MADGRSGKSWTMLCQRCKKRSAQLTSLMATPDDAYRLLFVAMLRAPCPWSNNAMSVDLVHLATSICAGLSKDQLQWSHLRFRSAASCCRLHCHFVGPTSNAPCCLSRCPMSIAVVESFYYICGLGLSVSDTRLLTEIVPRYCILAQDDVSAQENMYNQYRLY